MCIKNFLLSIALIVVTYFNLDAQSNGGAVPGKNYIVRASRDTISDLKRSGDIRFSREISPGYYIAIFKNEPAPGIINILGRTNNNWKLSPTVEAEASGIFTVSTIDLENFKTFLKSLCIEVLQEHTISNTITIKTNDPSAIGDIIQSDEVVWVEKYRLPIEETPNSYQDNSVNKINLVHNMFPELAGEGINISVKERAIDSTDIDLKNRIRSSVLKDQETSSHATQIATIIAGGGNTLPSTKGVAWKSFVSSSSFLNLLPDDNAVLVSENVSVQNHSYGIGIENVYGAEAHAYDASVDNNRTLLHVFSSGNSGTLTASSGQYSAVQGYANLTGNMKMAKNVLVIGAHQKDLSIDSRNSRGPAYDGRIKPELIAFGPQGTSDAAALVSGAVALLQDVWKKKAGTMPTVDLIKSALIATADDAGSSGVDFTAGYGAVNAYKAVQILKNNFIKTGSVTQGQQVSYDLEISEGIKTLKVALSYIDPPANAGDAHALVNDLDLDIVRVSSGVQWLPWVLSPYPHLDSLNAPAKRKRDRLNNVELVSLEDPEPGMYRVNITGHTLNSATQNFCIAYWLDSADVFRWTYPTHSDQINTEQEIYFRWETTYDDNASLEVSIDDGPFEEISGEISLQQGFYAWTPAVQAGTMIARMKIGNKYFFTDTVRISKPLDMQVGYLCEDELMLQWDKLEQAEKYQVFALGSQYMEPVMLVEDTVVIVDRNVYPSDHFAVAPVIDGDGAYRSAAYDVQNQGVKCYYSVFYASNTTSGSADLTLMLSSILNVDRIVWEKNVDGVFNGIGQTDVNDRDVLYTFEDRSLKSGVTEYRAGIFLTDGTLIYTDTAQVYYAATDNYFVFPNPVVATQHLLQVLTDGEDVEIQFYDYTGKIVKLAQIRGALNRVNMSDLPPGFYLYSIRKNARVVHSGKLVLK